MAARRARQGHDAVATEDLFRRYTDTKDEGLRERLICQNIHLVDTVARRFTGLGESPDDVAQEGTMGLINAVDMYDVGRGVKFTTYATHLIVGHIQHYLRDRGKAIRLPAWVQELETKINRAIDALTQELGRSPTMEEIARRLNISESSVADTVRARERTRLTSLDAAPDDDADPGLSPLERETAASQEFDPGVLAVEDRILLEEMIGRLKQLEQKVIRGFFFHGLNQTEIARRLGISVNYASYLLRGAVGKLRETVGASAEPAPEAERALPPLPPCSAVKDEETGLASESYFRLRLREELERVRRYRAPCALLMVEINADEERLDAASLRQAAKAIKQMSRRTDLLARVGDDRLAVIMPHTGMQARALAERIRSRVGVAAPAAAKALHAIYGIAVCPQHGDTDEALLTHAQQALEASRLQARTAAAI